MKVLFAVSNDSISEAIIKRYPKEYRELLSYKNVYYFNAILKEIQNDKSYDRIVISEDLEPFVNTNNDSIDNFIYEHLDKISDEAQGVDGKEMAIILICSERRTFGSSILNKLFSIGIYNALIGNDRSMTELCKLINRPRTKKEAKLYYKIDQATYDPASGDSGEVKEAEIQNILNHFKKLGKNTERYADSFNNIAAQYTDEQLKIIINVLPMKVKAVLEEESEKYQSLMGSSGKINKKDLLENAEPGIKVNTIGKASNINGPIVIPSGVKSFSGKANVTASGVVNNVVKVQRQTADVVTPKPAEEVVKPQPVASEANANNSVTASQENDLTALFDDAEKTASVDTETQEPVQEKKGRGRPKKPVLEDSSKEKGKRGRPKKNQEDNDQFSDLLNSVSSDTPDVLPGLEDIEVTDDVLPGLEDNTSEDILPGLEDANESETLPGLEEISLDETSNELPGVEAETNEEDDAGEEVDVSSLLAGLDDDDESSTLPGLEEDTDDASSNDDMLPGLDEESSDETSDLLPGLEDEEETILPGMGFDNTVAEEVPEKQDFSKPKEPQKTTTAVESIKPKIDYSMSNLNSLLSRDKKIVSFVGTTKNGTSFLVNNLALMFSLMGIDTAILDMTQNRNSYYIFTDSREELRNIAYTSISKLESGYAEGIKFNKNLTVYTALPADGNVYENAEPILSTLVQNHSLVLIDCDFNTPPAYFASCQEIYLVQSMDILTIQPLTAFLRDLKFKGAWEPEKARVVINKEIPVKILTNKMIIGGMSRYNGPDMSVMTDLFNKDMVKACSVPFDEKAYSKYLETMATCKLSLSGYSKQFMSKLQMLGEMVYPRLNGKASYEPNKQASYNNTGMNPENAFSSSTNSTLNKMKNRY